MLADEVGQDLPIALRLFGVGDVRAVLEKFPARTGDAFVNRFSDERRAFIKFTGYDQCGNMDFRQAINHIPAKVKAIDLVADGHIKWRGSGAFFLEAPHVEVLVVGPAIAQAMY